MRARLHPKANAWAFGVVVAIAVGTLVPEASRATLLGEVDQEHLGLENPTFWGAVHIAQTFTVGTAGILSGVELLGVRGVTGDGSGYEASVDIFSTVDVSGHLLPDISIASRTVFLPPFPEPVEVDFLSDQIEVNVGDVLAIVINAMSAVDPGANVQWFTGGPNYEGGILQVEMQFLELENDAAFRTFVVPEPAAALLLGAGLIALAVRRRSGH